MLDVRCLQYLWATVLHINQNTDIGLDKSMIMKILAYSISAWFKNAGRTNETSNGDNHKDGCWEPWQFREC